MSAPTPARFGRVGLYSVLALGIALAGWAHARGLPQLKEAKHLEKELSDLPEPPPGGPSASQVAVQVQRLRREHADLQDQVTAARALGPELEVALAALARRSGLQVEGIRTTAAQERARGARVSARLHARLRGDFAQVRAFVQGLDGLDLPVVAEKMRIALVPAPGPDEGPLRLELEVVP